MSVNNLRHQAITARARARRQLLQVLYQWQISGDSPDETYHSQIEHSVHHDIDNEYFYSAWQYITTHYLALEKLAKPCSKRALSNLDPVERAILWIGIFEFTERFDIHHHVSINEAVTLAKQFGSEESYKFINSVLDKLATILQESKKV